jgi:dTDP-glucose 4,6-dehydratase
LNIDDFKSELLGIENGDIASVEDLTHVFTKYNNIETVINFAAESHVDRSITDSSPFIQSNIVGVSNLLEFLRKGRFNKFIQISTDEVYGSILNGSWDESSALEPRSPYSASKASADMLCEAYRITHSLDISITRCANNYGTHQSVDKLIPKIITFAAKNKKIPVYGDGSNIREWLHVSDHVSAIMNVFHGQKVGGRSVYNIAGNPMTNLDLVQKILDLMDKDESLIEFGPSEPPTPCGPVSPVDPVAPTGPVSPVGPIGPPLGPVGPCGPVIPPDTVEPTIVYETEYSFEKKSPSGYEYADKSFTPDKQVTLKDVALLNELILNKSLISNS